MKDSLTSSGFFNITVFSNNFHYLILTHLQWVYHIFIDNYNLSVTYTCMVLNISSTYDT